MSVRALFVVALALCTTGCLTATAVEQQPTLANVQALRRAEIPALQLGEFRLAPGLHSGMDRSISVRGNTLNAPNGSFAGYLRQTLEAELRAAGKLDPASGATISAQLTRSEINTGSGNTGGVVAARFVVTRGGATIYDREHTSSDTWNFEFIGAVAVPEAMTRYQALYPKLVTQLVQDPEFSAAFSPVS